MKSIWKGSITFGLVNIPVQLQSAVKSSTLDFNLVHKTDLCPINYARVCRKTGQEIPYEDIAKAYEIEKDKLVVLDDYDFEAANAKKYNSILILGFVKNEKIDRIYYEKPYYLEPQSGYERLYFLFHRILQQTGKTALGKFILRNREHLCTIEIFGGKLMLYQLRFAQELRPSDFKIKQYDLDRREIDLARALVENLSGEIDIKEFRDTYSDELLSIIKRKASGEKIRRPKRPAQKQPANLVDVLQKSLKNLPKSSRRRNI